MNAENTYVFRHAILRDAAYQLQLPGDRARLHTLAFAVLESLCGGPPPDPPPLDLADPPPFQPHPTDPFALELAGHARAARVPGEARYLQRAIDVASRQFQHEAAQEAAMRLAALVPGPARGAALRRAGHAARLRGRTGEAEELFLQARELFRDAERRDLEASALDSLGLLYGNSGRARQSREALQESLAIAREIGDRRAELRTRARLAQADINEGLFGESEQVHREVLAAARASGDRAGEAPPLLSLAMAHYESGRLDEAERHYKEALEIFRSEENWGVEPVILVNLANLYRGTGRPALGLNSLEEALVLLRKIGNRRYEGVARATLSHHLQSADRLEEAETCYLEALGIHREVGDLHWESLTLGNLACLYRDTNRTADALRFFEECFAASSRIEGGNPTGTFRCELAIMRLREGRAEEARCLWLEGISFLERNHYDAEARRKRLAMREECEKAGVAPFEEPPRLSP